MSERFHYHGQVSINLYGATEADVKLALEAACKQHSDGIPKSVGALPGNTAQFSFNTTLHNVADGPGPVPAPPTKS